MKVLTSKQLRIIGNESALIFSKKGFFAPKSIEEFKIKDPLTREFTLPDRRMFLFTDAGMASLKRIVSLLDESDLFEGLAQYPDIWSACRFVVIQCLTKGEIPENGAEMVQLIQTTIAPEIDTRSFVVAIFGVELKGIDDFPLGTSAIVRPSKQIVQDLKVRYVDDDLAQFIEHTSHGYWLVGSAIGTPGVARARFKAAADLVTGLLALVAATLYEQGAHGFRIGIVMTPEEGYGRAKYLSWSDKERSLTMTYQFAGSQQLALDAEMRSRLVNSDVCKKAFSLFAVADGSELEEAIRRAVYWYSDAHRDQVMVMRLLKYWSCVETIFSVPRETTQSVSLGLADALVFGPVRFLKAEGHPALVSRIVKLYDKRSRATHGASYQHVSERDAADLSQWVAWMLYNVISLAAHGISTLDAMRSWLESRRANDLRDSDPQPPSE